MKEFEAEEVSLMKVRKANNVEVVNFAFTSIALTIIAAIIIGIAIAVFIGSVIANPIISITTTMRELANGNTSLKVPGLGRADEIGRMAKAVEVFKQNSLDKVRLEAEEKQAAKEREASKKAEELRAKQQEQEERDRTEKENAARVESSSSASARNRHRQHAALQQPSCADPQNSPHAR